MGDLIYCSTILGKPNSTSKFNQLISFAENLFLTYTIIRQYLVKCFLLVITNKSTSNFHFFKIEKTVDMHAATNERRSQKYNENFHGWMGVDIRAQILIF